MKPLKGHGERGGGITLNGTFYFKCNAFAFSSKIVSPQKTLHSLTKCCDGNRMRWEKQLRNVSRGNAALLNEKENVL